MKLLITCGHLVRHIRDHMKELKNSGLEWQALNPKNQQFNSQEILEILPGNNFIIAGDDEINQKAIKVASNKGLKAIVKWGIGVDNIDLKAAREFNIPVFNTPNVFGYDVAEQAMSYILSLSRSTHIIDYEVRNGNWHKVEGSSLYGKKLGLIGFGSIGQEIAKRGKAFGMEVFYCDPYFRKESFLDNPFLKVEFEKICEISDFIVLACSLNKNNIHLINKDSISMMLKKPYIINVSRGPLINEKDLIQALKEKKLRGVGLDVFEKEPLPIDSDLIKIRNCILGSHNSSNTVEAVKRVNNMTIKMVIDMISNNVYEIFEERRIV